MNFWERKKHRTEYYLRFIYGWKQRPCISCNGSGYYDWDNGPCGACDGDGIELYPGPKSIFHNNNQGLNTALTEYYNGYFKFP